MKTSFLFYFVLFASVLSITFYSCVRDEYDIIVETSSLPACFFCSSEEGDLDFCYQDLYEEIAVGGVIQVPIPIQGNLEITVPDDIEEEFLDDLTSYLYSALLYVAIEGGYTCFTEGACECEDGQKKIEICHVPPGNPGNAKTKLVNCNSLDAHLAHGDFCGDCESMGLGLEINMDNIEDYLNEQFCILLGNTDPCPTIVLNNPN